MACCAHYGGTVIFGIWYFTTILHVFFNFLNETKVMLSTINLFFQIILTSNWLNILCGINNVNIWSIIWFYKAILVTNINNIS